jgi:TorA maturation chaperone TorD
MSAPAAGPDVSRARARSLVYRVLADAFRHPRPGHADAVRGAVGLAGAHAPEVPAAVAAALAGVEAALADVTDAGLEAAFVTTFGHVTVPDCPLYETACDAGDPFRQPQALADLVGFYRAFGLEVGAAERADSLAIELEFMHYLAYREAYALTRHGPEAIAVLRDGERRFLAEHVGRWAPVVARAVGARSTGALAAAAHLLEAFLAWEAVEHGIAVREVVLEGAPVPAGDAEDDAWEDEA